MIEDRKRIVEALGGRLTTNDDALIDRVVEVVTKARAEQRELLNLCRTALLSLPEDALGRDPEGWLYRDELLAQIDKASPRNEVEPK